MHEIVLAGTKNVKRKREKKEEERRDMKKDEGRGGRAWKDLPFAPELQVVEVDPDPRRD